MFIYLGNTHLHHTKTKDDDVVSGIIVDDVEDIVEDKEGDV